MARAGYGGVLRAEVRQEEAVEVDEVRRLQGAVGFLSSAITTLEPLQEDLPKEAATRQNLMKVMQQRVAGFPYAARDIGEAIKRLRSSLEDEKRLIRVAQQVRSQAVAVKSSQLAAIAQRAANNAVSHRARISSLISDLQKVIERLEGFNTITIIDLPSYFGNFINTAKNSKLDLEGAIYSIEGYIGELSALFRILNKVEGKKPWWRFW